MNSLEKIDCAIIGGGITGTALLYALSRFTTLRSIALFEMRGELGSVNTHYRNNSQTLHAGDIETNYSPEKAREVKHATDLLANYLDRHGKGSFIKQEKMVIAVGPAEVAELAERFSEFASLFPNLRMIERDEIARLEPKVMEGRDPNIPILALATAGYTVNFKHVARLFALHAQEDRSKEISLNMGRSIAKIEKTSSGYAVTTQKGETYLAKTVVVAAGPHSLLFAKQLGYAGHLGLLPVAGSFYYARPANLLNGKVYTMQNKKLPFAAVHGDPEFTDPSVARFGPTAKVLPMLIRHSYRTIIDFMKTSVWSPKGIASLAKIISDPTLFTYMLKNVFYDIPVIGKWFFLQTARKVVPALTYADLAYAAGTGGIRPQIVNSRTGALEMGDAQIIGDKILFNITPSPGASVCLANARKDAKHIVSFIENASFNEEKWQQEFSAVPETANV